MSEEMKAVLNYVADMTYCGADAEWHFKPGYDPQRVLDALNRRPSPVGGGREEIARAAYNALLPMGKFLLPFEAVWATEDGGPWGKLADAILALISPGAIGCGEASADAEVFAGLDAGGSGAWRPIETAPRNGSWVHLYSKKWPIWAYPLVGWSDGPGEEWQFPAHPQWAAEMPYPTHWQPLPSPPPTLNPEDRKER